MAVSSVKHNKPVLPRTSDGSDLGSNRASIYSGKALSFDGANDHVGVDSSFMPDNADFSVSLYVKINTITSPKAIIGSWDSNYNGFAIGISQDRLRAWANDGANSGLTYVEAADLISGIYYHVILSYDYSTGTQTGYLNGVNIGSDTYPDTMTHNAFNIGKAMAGYGYGDVDVSDVRVYNSTITDAQAKEIYDNPEQSIPTGFSSTNLILHLPMTEGAGSVVYNANAGAIGTELISNAGFDETCQKWGTTDDATVEIAGGKAIWTNAPLSGSFVEQPLDLEAGKFYRVSFDYTSTAFNLFVNLGDTQEAVPLGNGRYTYDMYYGTGNKSIKFQHGWTTSSSASVDNVSVKEVVPNYYNGTINGATWVSGLPEPLPQTALMDWNKGTNHFTKTDFGDVNVWTRNGVGLSAWYDEKFFEGQVYRLEENTSTSYHNLYHNNIVLTDHYYSVFAKAGSLDTLAFIEIATSPYPTVQFNLSTGVITETIGSNWDDYSMTDVGNGWYYLTAKYTGTSSKVHYNLIPKAGDANGSYLGGGSSNYLYVSSPSFSEYKNIFIPTYGTAQTSPVLIKEGSTAGKDVFGNTITNPRASGAYNFDGDSWAEVENNASLDITDAITLECWINSTDKDQYHHIISKNKSGDANYAMLTEITTGYLGFELIAGEFKKTDYNVMDGNWNHVVVTYDETNLKFYINGALDDAIAYTSSIPTNDVDLHIGARPDGVQLYEADIAQPRIYNYALTAQQVADNFNEKASTFGGTKVASELDAYIERTASDGATVEAHSCLVNYLTELDKK